MDPPAGVDELGLGGGAYHPDGAGGADEADETRRAADAGDAFLAPKRNGDDFSFGECGGTGLEAVQKACCWAPCVPN